METETETAHEPITLYSLPNEVLVQILTPFLTRDLLPLTSVSHRFHALILRILHYRLLLAASLDEYKLILECFHPSCKATEPYLLCSYLGTDGLSDKHEGEGSLYESCSPAGYLGRLGGLYSRFRPRQADGEPRIRVRSLVPPTGIVTVNGNPVPTDEAAGAHLQQQTSSNGDGGLVSHTITLDGYEHFSQLCTVTNLVHRGAFPTCVNVVDGIVRLWRDWLDERAASSNAEEEEEIDTRVGETEKIQHARHIYDDPSILWVDGKRNVGLKLRVHERTWNRENMPVLVREDEDVTHNYEVEFEELLIRTTKLLLSVEASSEEQQNGASKAIIFGTFAQA